MYTQRIYGAPTLATATFVQWPNWRLWCRVWNCLMSKYGHKAGLCLMPKYGHKAARAHSERLLPLSTAPRLPSSLPTSQSLQQVNYIKYARWEAKRAKKRTRTCSWRSKRGSRKETNGLIALSRLPSLSNALNAYRKANLLIYQLLV